MNKEALRGPVLRGFYLHHPHALPDTARSTPGRRVSRMTDMVSSRFFCTAETNPVIRLRGQYCEKNILWINKTEPHGAG